MPRYAKRKRRRKVLSYYPGDRVGSVVVLEHMPPDETSPVSRYLVECRACEAKERRILTSAMLCRHGKGLTCKTCARKRKQQAMTNRRRFALIGLRFGEFDIVCCTGKKGDTLFWKGVANDGSIRILSTKQWKRNRPPKTDTQLKKEAKDERTASQTTSGTEELHSDLVGP